MHSHTKKMIAPIIIVFLNLVYYAAFAVFFVGGEEDDLGKY